MSCHAQGEALSSYATDSRNGSVDFDDYDAAKGIPMMRASVLSRPTTVYTLGDGVIIDALFRDAKTAKPTDPATVTFKLRAPNNVETSYVFGTDAEVTKQGTGLYRLKTLPTLVGTTYYRIVGATTGGINVAVEWSFRVNASVFKAP